MVFEYLIMLAAFALFSTKTAQYKVSMKIFILLSQLGYHKLRRK